jgi:hypothetical protein
MFYCRCGCRVVEMSGAFYCPRCDKRLASVGVVTESERGRMMRRRWSLLLVLYVVMAFMIAFGAAIHPVVSIVLGALTAIATFVGLVVYTVRTWRV